jgi:HupE/UreJ protein
MGDGVLPDGSLPHHQVIEGQRLRSSSKQYLSHPSPLRVAAVILAAMLAGVGAAAAHGIGLSQLRLRVDGPRIDGAWEVQLRDAQIALDRDPQRTGEAGWQDLRGEEASLRDYLVRRISLTADGLDCSPEPTASPLEWQGEQGQVVVPIVYACARPPTRLVIHCDLLFDRDSKHRTYFSLQDERVTHLGVFRADQRSDTIDVHYFHWAAGFLEFVREGIAHIWGGLDHVLFLLTLLLPAPLSDRSGARSGTGDLRSTTREVLKVVTAFTIAHSLTLCLSFFGFLSLPARWVEVGIALSVFAAAWNNLRPFLPGRAWAMALAFGLIHGLGFAGALRNLSLPFRARGLALAAFNVGVELGQLAIVALVLPLLYVASKRSAYRRLVMGAASLGIAWLAALWVLERAFGLSLLGRS